MSRKVSTKSVYPPCVFFCSISFSVSFVKIYPCGMESKVLLYHGEGITLVMNFHSNELDENWIIKRDSLIFVSLLFFGFLSSSFQMREIGFLCLWESLMQNKSHQFVAINSTIITLLTSTPCDSWEMELDGTREGFFFERIKNGSNFFSIRKAGELSLLNSFPSFFLF